MRIALNTLNEKKPITIKRKISLSSVSNSDVEVEAPKQKFFVEATERTFTVRFNNSQFGVVKHDALNRFENLQRNCESKEQKVIANVITIMKTYLKAGMNFEQLQTRMSKNDALFAPSIKVFINRINKEA